MATPGRCFAFAVKFGGFPAAVSLWRGCSTLSAVPSVPVGKNFLVRLTGLGECVRGDLACVAAWQVRNDRNDVQVISCGSANDLPAVLEQLPKLPHVVVAGETNAGKSSLINHLLRKKNLARASSVPGKTRELDFMVVNRRFILVDTPGLPTRDHQTAKMWQSEFQPLLSSYLSGTKACLFIYAHDCRWRVTYDEEVLMKDVRELWRVPLMLVLTKDDKLDGLGKGRPTAHELRNKSVEYVRTRLSLDEPHVHYRIDNSALSRHARRVVLRIIEASVTGESWTSSKFTLNTNRHAARHEGQTREDT